MSSSWINIDKLGTKGIEPDLIPTHREPQSLDDAVNVRSLGSNIANAGGYAAVSGGDFPGAYEVNCAMTRTELGAAESGWTVNKTDPSTGRIEYHKYSSAYAPSYPNGEITVDRRVTERDGTLVSDESFTLPVSPWRNQDSNSIRLVQNSYWVQIKCSYFTAGNNPFWWWNTETGQVIQGAALADGWDRITNIYTSFGPAIEHNGVIYAWEFSYGTGSISPNMPACADGSHVLLQFQPGAWDIDACTQIKAGGGSYFFSLWRRDHSQQRLFAVSTGIAAYDVYEVDSSLSLIGGWDGFAADEIGYASAVQSGIAVFEDTMFAGVFDTGDSRQKTHAWTLEPGFHSSVDYLCASASWYYGGGIGEMGYYSFTDATHALGIDSANTREVDLLQVA